MTEGQPSGARRAAGSRTRGWPLLIGGAPLLGAAFLVVAVLQGEREMLDSGRVFAVFTATCLIGLAAAAWTHRTLRAAAAVRIAAASEGVVALSGHARSPDGAPTLATPGGTACLWFTRSERVGRHSRTRDSVRPFVLDDGSARCLVLPEGAAIHGSSRHAGGDAAATPGMRLLCEGDEVHVVGWWMPASPDALQRQREAWRQAAADEGLPAEAMPNATAMPCIAVKNLATPFEIGIAARSGSSGFYAALAWADLVLLLLAAGGWWRSGWPPAS